MTFNIKLLLRHHETFEGGPHLTSLILQACSATCFLTLFSWECFASLKSSDVTSGTRTMHGPSCPLYHPLLKLGLTMVPCDEMSVLYETSSSFVKVYNDSVVSKFNRMDMNHLSDVIKILKRQLSLAPLGHVVHKALFSSRLPQSSSLRLVFTSDGVEVIIRSVKRYDLVRIKQRSRKQSFRLRLRFRRLRSSEIQIVGVVSRSGRKWKCSSTSAYDSENLFSTRS